ncbi:MAG: AAA family ATPase [Muribaculaceae bacterium]
MKQTEKEAIAAKLRAYVESKESQNAAAKSLRGVSAATVSQMLNGNWELISDDMWRTVANQTGYDPRRWSVVETEGYTRMTQVLTDAQLHSLVMAVVGDAGCGKSQAIKAYAEQHRGVIALSCSEYWNRKEFLSELLQSLGTEPGGSTVADMVREAIRQLKRRDGVLIILDEADKLSDQVLHFFITIYNKLEDTVGIVLCATQYLKKRIERGVVNNRKGYKEIYSRIGRKFIPMPVVNNSDIKGVCLANGLDDLREIARIIDDADNDLRRVKRLVCALKLKSSEN